MENVKYQVEKDHNDNYQLFVNGKNSACPFQSVFVTQNQLGAPAFIKQACNTSCPLAELEITADGMRYLIYCGGDVRKLQVEPKNQAAAPSLSIV